MTDVRRALRARRKTRVRAKISGTSDCPRLSVFRSNQYIDAQLIDDEKGHTLVSVYQRQIQKTSGTKSDIAKMIGSLLAEKAKEHKISRVRFDRNGYRYHGRVKSLAEGAREGGLIF